MRLSGSHTITQHHATSAQFVKVSSPSKSSGRSSLPTSSTVAQLRVSCCLSSPSSCAQSSSQMSPSCAFCPPLPPLCDWCSAALPCYSRSSCASRRAKARKSPTRKQRKSPRPSPLGFLILIGYCFGAVSWKLLAPHRTRSTGYHQDLMCIPRKGTRRVLASWRKQRPNQRQRQSS